MTTTPVTTTDPPPPIPLDERPIAEMYFSGGDETRAILQQCHVSKAFEIELLGCTGAAGFGLSIGEITKLRLGLGGGGVGLPCFVPPTLFCLAHNTVGGLQRDQEQRNPENVVAISRELTPQEAGKVAFTETVRRTGKGGVGEQMAAAAGALGGFGELPRGVEMVEEALAQADIHELARARSACTCDPKLANCSTCKTGAFAKDPTDDPSWPPRLGAPSFTCPEHPETNWSCRFCIAQTIAEGELDTTFVVHQPDEEPAVVSAGLSIAGEAHFGLSGPELEAEVERRDAAGAKEIEVYVLAATYKRKLSR